MLIIDAGDKGVLQLLGLLPGSFDVLGYAFNVSNALHIGMSNFRGFGLKKRQCQIQI